MSGYFTALERELGRAAARRRRFRRRKTGAVIATAVVVLAGVPAVAAMTDVFEPRRESDGLVRLTEPRAIAEGTTPNAGDWRLIASESDVGPCLGIELSSSAPGARPEGCGRVPGSLTLSAASANGTIWLAYGRAPDGAETITIEGRGITTVTVPTTDDDAGLEGRFYVAELSARPPFGEMRVVARDDDGNVVAER